MRRRRRLDAKRARDYRLRRKAKQSIDTTSPRTESLCQAFEPGTEVTEAGFNSTPVDTREFEQEFIPVDDIGSWLFLESEFSSTLEEESLTCG